MRPAVRLFSGLRVVSLCTLLSRILGMVRDMGMAVLFGNGPVFDAFTVAFRVPNLARALFGEGALTAAFLPLFVRELERGGRMPAWRLAGTVFTLLAAILTLLVALGELSLYALARGTAAGAEAQLLLGLTAVMLPYLILICLAAQVSAVLNALGHFTWPALVPVVLNVVWITAIWAVAPQWDSPTAQIYCIATAVVIAGVLQFALPLPKLFQLGFRFVAASQSTLRQAREIGRIMLPVVAGLSITQLNTLSDSLIAWSFSAPAAEISSHASPETGFPLPAGTASALYLGQRLYQFPLGIFGVALGTVLFPLLSRHAERGEFDRLRDDLTLGLKLVVIIGVPASAGLMLLAEPLATLLFQYQSFTSNDARQTAEMIAAYGVGVWAYCGLLIVHRAYYAVGDRQTPVRVGLAAILLNLILNFTLIWPLGGPGLALSTALAAMLQVSVVAWYLQDRIGRLGWHDLMQTAVRVLVATALMAGACLLTFAMLTAEDATVVARLVRVVFPLAVAVGTYFAAAWLLGISDLWRLFQRDRKTPDNDERARG